MCPRVIKTSYRCVGCTYLSFLTAVRPIQGYPVLYLKKKKIQTDLLLYSLDINNFYSVLWKDNSEIQFVKT